MRTNILSLAMLLFTGAHAAFAQASCPASTALHLAVFNTTDTTDAPFVLARTSAMAAALPQAAQSKNLDVLCLTEMRDSASRDTALQGFRNDPTWNVYQPPHIEQPGCRRACATDAVYTAYGFILPWNKWVEYCSLTPVPGRGIACAQAQTNADYLTCLAEFCPFLPANLTNGTPSCGYCLANAKPGESLVSRVFRCSDTFTDTDAANCRYGYNGEAGGTLISRYPFLATEYHQFNEVASSSQPGSANRGVTYGKIQTPIGPVHLFCASHATAESGMDTAAAETLNAAENLDLLTYIQTKANGETAVYLADTGSGPAIVSSPTGPATAQFLPEFTTLQSTLTDALLNNLDNNFKPASAAGCTYGCSVSTPTNGSYVDHIMTSGKGSPVQGYSAALCERNGELLFTSAIVNTSNGAIPLSTHYGVHTDLSLLGPSYQLTLSDNAPSHTLSQGTNNKTVTATLTTSALDSFGLTTVAFTLPTGLAQAQLTAPNNNWTCSGSTCSTTNVIPAGSTLAFTLTFNVQPNAANPQTIQASISGGMGQAANATPDVLTINPITNVSSTIKVTQNGFARNRATGLWNASMTVQNIGSTAINGPVQVVFNSLTPGVTMANNTGLRNGIPYLTVQAAGSLAPGATITVIIQFNNPNNALINFSPETDAGTF